MRIISGRLKGRSINSPQGIRPTQDKVRKAIFDILGDIEGLSFLELFSGSGAVGLEAASQRAGNVVFVERNPKFAKIIKDNLSLLGYLPYSVIALDVFKTIKILSEDKKKFDLIFLDPPYYKDMAKKTLKMLSTYDIVAPNGFVIIQHFKKDNLPEVSGDLVLFKQGRYGDTVLSFYRKG